MIHNNTREMVEESRRECEMRVVRSRIALIAAVAVVYACFPLWITSFSTKIPRRRTNEPTLDLPLGEVALTDSIQLELNRTSSTRQRKADTSHLNIAWLMSFPNSGTSYTMRLIARTTQTLVATNYQYTESSEERQLHPVFDDHSEGPFWPDPEESPYRPPPRYVLTKTHCGARCNDCSPLYYLRDTKDFERVCSTGSKLEVTSDGQEESVVVEYNATKVQKAVHLIRDPFDNVVSRFHLERHRMMKANDTESLSQFTDSRQGFRSFCRYMDDKWRDEVEATWMTDEIGIMRNIPCRDDFFRYVIWHNLAFMATDGKLRIPSMILYYEDYSERFNETVKDLLDFLDLKQVTEPYPFHGGHTYDDYFTEQERESAKQAVKIISSKTTWHHVRHYFPQKQ